MLIIGGWHVRLSAIIAYSVAEPELGMKPYIEVLLVSSDKVSGYISREEVDLILHHFLGVK